MAKETQTERSASIRAISRSVEVLQAINRSGSLTLTHIAEAVELPYPTVNRIVRTLIEVGLVEQEPSRKRYRPTALVQTLSCGFQNHDRLVSTARPHIVALTHAIDWPVSVVTRVGQQMMVRDSTSTLTSLTFNNYYPGWQVPLLASASGRVYFAHAAEQEQAELLRQYEIDHKGVDGLVLKDFRDGDAAAKIREAGFAAVARTGYSANPGRTSSIAVPLFEGPTLLGSLALVFFAQASSIPKAIERLLEPLRNTALAIQHDLETDGSRGGTIVRPSVEENPT
jgi:IclR family mhp operon transcriptional activator